MKTRDVDDSDWDILDRLCSTLAAINCKHYSSDFWLSKLPPENDTVTIHHLHNTLNWPGPHHFLLSTSICHLSVTYFSMSCLRSAALWCDVQAWISWENVFFLDNCRVFLKPPTPIPVWGKGISFLAAWISVDNFPQNICESKILTHRDKECENPNVWPFAKQGHAWYPPYEEHVRESYGEKGEKYLEKFKEKWGQLWEKIMKVMRGNEESYEEKWGKLLGKNHPVISTCQHH